MLSAMPSPGRVNTVIRITMNGDHDQLEWLISINGIRTPLLDSCLVAARDRSCDLSRPSLLKSWLMAARDRSCDLSRPSLLKSWLMAARDRSCDLSR
ncbi:hypothetical protein HPQ61_24410, partial [Acetobacteraceae bacterium]|nr:hypothetical protein [Acetobacteraceae bacterium]